MDPVRRIVTARPEAHGAQSAIVLSSCRRYDRAVLCCQSVCSVSACSERGLQQEKIVRTRRKPIAGYCYRSSLTQSSPVIIVISHTAAFSHGQQHRGK